jgi:lipoyl-dependent peroxiredoxin
MPAPCLTVHLGKEGYMAEIQRRGQAQWNGALKGGSGTTSTGSGVLKEVPYSVPSRFENAGGTNPEELLAAAHASCFSMMLAKILGDQNKAPGQIRTEATLTMGQQSGGWKITKVHLKTEVRSEGLSAQDLESAANQAKDQCPVSVLLKPGLESVTLEARLAS